MALRSKLLLLLGLAIVYYLNPLYIRSSAFSVARSLHGYVDLTPDEDPDSLKAAIANVTTDVYQLTTILEDFFQRQPNEEVEENLKEFLKRKAVRKHRDLEYYLDWILGFYRFAWPFVLVYALMKLSSKKHIEDGPAISSRKYNRTRKKVEGKLKEVDSDDEAEVPNGLNALTRDEGRLIKQKSGLHRRAGSAQAFQ